MSDVKISGEWKDSPYGRKYILRALDADGNPIAELEFCAYWGEYLNITDEKVHREAINVMEITADNILKNALMDLFKSRKVEEQ